MNRVPPNGAVWMLERFGIPRRKPELMGDLTEEFASGRSAAWYWGQVLAAVGVALTVDIRYYPRLFLVRAILTGWVVSRVLPVVLHVPLYGSGPFILLSICLFVATVGWIVGRTHRAYPGVGILAWITCLLVRDAWVDLPQGIARLNHVFPLELLVVSFMLFGGLLGSVPARKGAIR